MLPKRLINFALLFHEAVNKGLLLIGSTLLAIILANSQFSHLYNNFVEQDLAISLGKASFSLSIHGWVNDFLMAIFFLAVGMEIKREMMDGHLTTKEQRILPVVSACFGVIFPVLIYIAFNFNDNVAMQAWATPAATDIAFALGVFAILGRRLPVALRVFLTALAIIDDLIAVIIIALFYAGPLQLEYFPPIMLCCLLLYLFNRSRLISLAPYLLVGMFMWYFFFKSGIHSTISGVLLGAFIPLKISKDSYPLKRLEKILTPYVAYLILPLFAFSNSGVNLGNIHFETLFHPVVLGIVLGLFVGKTVGISCSVHILQKLRVISISQNISIRHFYFVSILCGIGFTMSLFIALIAFENNPIYFEFAKVGIILGSVLSVAVATITMKFFQF